MNLQLASGPSAFAFANLQGARTRCVTGIRSLGTGHQENLGHLTGVRDA